MIIPNIKFLLISDNLFGLVVFLTLHAYIRTYTRMHTQWATGITCWSIHHTYHAVAMFYIVAIVIQLPWRNLSA